jgi:predicted ATPase
MINRFRLCEFKGHRHTELELGRFTMLVGDNASGKTSVLEALSLQSALCSTLNLLRGNLAPLDLLRRGSIGPIVFASNGVLGGVPWNTLLNVNVQVNPMQEGDGPGSWTLTATGRRGETKLIASEEKKSVAGDWSEFELLLGTAALYRLRAERIAAAAYSEALEADIKLDGTNTAVALAAMKLGNDEAFQRVEDAMRQLVPAVQRVRIRPATVRRSAGKTVSEVVGSKLYFDFQGAPRVPAHGASHGTLIVLALLAVLHGSNRPDLILLDDFDHALHPRAQMELVRMIKRLLALDDFQGVQIVATTHSPYALDELDPSEVQVFALRDDGTVASKRLSEHPEAERTRGTLKAGQLWSLDPERDWVLQG